jgi:hypothetical protein
MGIRETLQEALVNANNHRHECHVAIQNLDSRLVQAKATLEKAKSNKIGADEINQRAIKDHQALTEHCGKLQDPAAREALHPDINRLGLEQNAALRNAIRADEAYRQHQSSFSELEKERVAANARLTAATGRWEQIRKQIEDLNH